MQGQVERFMESDVAAFTAVLAELEVRIDPSAEAARDAYWRQLDEAFRSSQEACRRLESEIGDDADLLAEARKRFQEATSCWFMRSWIAHRARTKPNGFPGDYAMLRAIYAGLPKARGLGAYLDLCLLDLPLGKAVEARMRATRELLADELSRRRGDVRILNIACGPCHEYVGGFDYHRGGIDVTCIDNDPAALDFVGCKVAPAATGMELRPTRYNALRMKSAEATVRKFGRFDIIYSIGLCDYLPDDYLIGMLKGWRGSLAEEGVLYVAFKDCTRYDHTPYQWHLDWHFLQRTEEDCLRLFDQAGFDVGAIETSRDDTGIIINFISKAKEGAVLRFDTADFPQPAAVPATVPSDPARQPQQI